MIANVDIFLVLDYVIPSNQLNQDDESLAQVFVNRSIKIPNHSSLTLSNALLFRAIVDQYFNDTNR